MNRTTPIHTCAILLAAGSLFAWSATFEHTAAADSPAPKSAPLPRRTKPGPVPAADSLEVVMAKHFVIASWARDVVISGQVEPLREVLAGLADYSHEAVKNDAWKPWVAQLQAASRVTAHAPNVRVAAKGVAAMGRACGECHAATGRGPKFSPESTDVFLPYVETFPERMGRHMLAAEQLWLGLTGPSDASWKAGALALRDAPSKMDEWLPDTFTTELDHVRKLGERAQGARTPAERATLYGQVLATCASCHTRWMEYGL